MKSQPWLPELNEGFASVCEQFPDLTTPSPSAAAGKAFLDAMLPLVRKMIAELFTPERIGQLGRTTQGLPERTLRRGRQDDH